MPEPMGRYQEKTQTRFEVVPPGTLCKFHEELAIVFVNAQESSHKILKRGAVLMYIETIKYTSFFPRTGNTIIYYDHRFLDLDGNIVMTIGFHKSSRALPSWEEAV